MRRYPTLIIYLLICTTNVLAQENKIKLTLSQAIDKAHSQSPSAIVAKHNFRASYWQFRSYKASLLPKLNLSSTLANYNRTLQALQSSQTGEINYREVNNMQNSATLSLDQNVAFTGGTLSVFSSLNRIDQFTPLDLRIYNSQPINITYLQPLRAFNALKWEKHIEPKEYERAKRNYLESMENITINVTSYFFDVILAQNQLDMADKNYSNTETLYNIAKERFNLGGITKSDLMQLELRYYNDGLSINEAQLQLNRAKFQFSAYLGYNDMVDIELVNSGEIPDIMIDYVKVLELSKDNSSFFLEQDLLVLNARKEVARNVASKGLSASIQAQFGLTQQAETLRAAYVNPIDQEIIKIGLSMPIIDWGQGRGRVRMALSREEVVNTQVEQAISNQRQNIIINVMQFNNQHRQCKISQIADSIARERYAITSDRFLNGAISVIDLNNSQTEKDQAIERYVRELRNYWVYYYTLRRISLYDFISDTNISTEFDKIVE